MIQTILIANRGEIACRIIRTCQRLGIHTVAVYSDADNESLHVQLADEAIHLGPAPAPESYLVVDNIIRAAQRTGVDAIHPGYGFLAESAALAQSCVEAGFIFIGPQPEAIKTMGNKRAAKQLMQSCGVPVMPGYSDINQSEASLITAAEELGFPLMVKAAAGGGGKGMRVVQSLAGLPEALAAARYESLQAFGSDELILEQLILNPRHIEFQIFGDSQGNLIHLGERDCSIQRRHQKVIEESPSPALTPALRQQIGAAAIAAGQAVNYTNAGTVEFLLDEAGKFYFLEMNTRIQVEHPVTEMVTGLDLIAWQIRVAEGETLPVTQDEIRLNGHAIEARLYAENPAEAFLPVSGDIVLWQPPSGEGFPSGDRGAFDNGVRVDSGIGCKDKVSIYYDPLLAKVIAHGPDRKIALRRLGYALQNSVLLGLTNNLSFLRAVCQHPAFQAGKFNTHFLANHFADWKSPAGNVTLALIAATIARFKAHPQLNSNSGYWRNNPNQPQLYRFIDQPDIYLKPALNPSQRAGELKQDRMSLNIEGYQLTIVDQNYNVRLREETEYTLSLAIEGHRQRVVFACVKQEWWVQTKTGVVHLVEESLLPKPQPTVGGGSSLRTHTPGVIIEVLVEVGQSVEKGQALLKLEAMKMEHTIRATTAGMVEAIYYQVGDTIEAEAELVKIAG